MRKLKNVTILGAGTAGWISAYILSDFFYTNKQDVKVTIVDPSSIPIIGVGEGTTGIFYDFLKRYNLDELDFLRETKATLKFGIVHKDWKELNHQYYGPIDDPHLLASKKIPEDFEYLNVYAVAAGRSVADVHLHARPSRRRRRRSESDEGFPVTIGSTFAPVATAARCTAAPGRRRAPASAGASPRPSPHRPHRRQPRCRRRSHWRCSLPPPSPPRARR